MSGAPIRLTPPPDQTKVIVPISIGVGIALVIYTLTRSTLPHVGDLSHSLPHGGSYRDGTKAVHYSGPSTLPSNHLPLLLIAFTVVAIYVSTLCSPRSRAGHCTHCGTEHH